MNRYGIPLQFCDIIRGEALPEGERSAFPTGQVVHSHGRATCPAPSFVLVWGSLTRLARAIGGSNSSDI